MRHLDYWAQLKKLHLYSLERRRERYIIIYIWRILEHQVPDITSGKIFSINEGGRLGRKSSFPPISNNAPSEIKKIRYASHLMKGPQQFNILPAEIRNLVWSSLLQPLEPPHLLLYKRPLLLRCGKFLTLAWMSKCLAWFVHVLHRGCLCALAWLVHMLQLGLSIVQLGLNICSSFVCPLTVATFMRVRQEIV